MAYRVLLTVTDETSKYNNQEFVFDFVNSKNINKSVDITTHPLVNGDLVGDHMYKNALTMNIGGKFNLNGSKYTNFLGEKDRLANIQAIFEEFMDKATIFNLKTSHKDDGKVVTRFLERANMVLNSIEWTENYNNLEFNLGFMQIIFSEIQEDTPEMLDDNTLTALTDAIALDFSELLFDDSQMGEFIIQMLYDNDMATKNFWIKTDLSVALKSVGIVLGTVFVSMLATAVAAGITYGAALVGASATAIASGPIGWIILAAAAVVVACAVVVYKVLKETKRKYKNLRKFRYYTNAKKREKEEKRFGELVAYLVDSTKTLGDYVKSYGITSDQNQELLTYIDNEYYVFKFERDNVTATEEEKGYYNLTVIAVSGETVSYGGKIKAEGSANFTEAATRCLFKTPNGHHVYLMNKELEKIRDTYSTSDNSSEMNPELQQKLKEAQYDLTNFYILDAAFDIAEYENVVTDIITNTMLNYEG